MIEFEMAANRKLQAEIDRCLKNVSQGVEKFEETLTKVHNAVSSNQREKHEEDLKKEIKKLQRMRGQIKTWVANGSINDPSLLVEKRKLIETLMEKFRIVEREMKTKAYSKEGRASAGKLDPAEKEREEMSQWLNQCLNTLTHQIAQIDAKTGNLGSTKKKKGKNTSEHLQEHAILIEKHNEHIQKLETLLRMLDNDFVSVDQIKNIKEDVEYYIENCEEPDFAENEMIYADIDGLEEMLLDFSKKGGDKSSVGFNTDLTNNNTNSVSEASETTSISPTSSPIQTKNCNSKIQQKINTLSDQGVDNLTTKRRCKSFIDDVKGLVPSMSEVNLLSLDHGDLSSHDRSKATPAANLCKSVDSGSNSSPSPGLSGSLLSGFPTLKSIAQDGLSDKQDKLNKTREQMKNHPQDPGISDSQVSISSELNLPSQEYVYSTNIKGPKITIAANFGKPKDIAIRNTSTIPDVSTASSSEVFMTQGVPNRLERKPDRTRVAPSAPAPPNEEIKYQYTMLEAAFKHMPHCSDSERQRLYLRRNPCATPLFYPQLPLPGSDSVEFFQRLSTETLFFIFYYMEGTRAQYLAAKALKKQSWRFHTKYMMWFQRHEEPKIINEDYEQGSYIYFDYEKWGQRKKEGFTFEYRFLEDRDLN